MAVAGNTHHMGGLTQRRHSVYASHVKMRTALALSISGCIVALLAAVEANAALIDFRNQTYLCDPACADGNPDGATSATLDVGGVIWTFTPNPAGTVLYWDNVDGFGVD